MVEPESMFGITEGDQWIIRLHWVKGKPSFSTTVPLGPDKEVSLAKAKKIRDTQVARLMKKGIQVNNGQPPFRTNTRNKSGVSGVQLCFVATPLGGYYKFRTFFCTHPNQLKSKSFACRKYGFHTAFVEAIKAKREADFTYHGYTLVPEIGFMDTRAMLVACIRRYGFHDIMSDALL